MSILEMLTFREPCSSLHQGEEQPELFLRVIPLFYITLLVGAVEGKKKIVDMREKSVSLSLTGSFPCFIYVVAVISI